MSMRGSSQTLTFFGGQIVQPYDIPLAFALKHCR